MTAAADTDLLNRVINQPEVLHALAPGYLTIDLTGFFDAPGNLMLGDDRGVVLFAYCGDGTYEMHYALTSSLRGKAALQAIRTAIGALFTYRDAHAIVGSTPRDNRAARVINRALGGRPYGVSVDSMGRDCIDYVLERATWVQYSAV
jgi:RimJ/RimL family protein N-acetyltransferase